MGVSKVFQGYFKEVLRVFQGRLRGVPRDLQWWFKGASRISKRSSKGVFREFQGSFKDILRKFQGCLKKVSSVFQENFKKKVSMVFQEWFNEVLFCNFVFAWISSQLPEQKEGLLSVLGSRHILLKSKMSMLKHCYCPLAPGFLSKSQGKGKTRSWLYFCNIKTNNNWQEPSNDFHWRNCNTPFWWTMTFDERQPLMVDNHWWKTTLDGRWTSMFDGPQILLKDGLWLKMTFDGRQPLMRVNLR